MTTTTAIVIMVVVSGSVEEMMLVGDFVLVEELGLVGGLWPANYYNSNYSYKKT